LTGVLLNVALMHWAVMISPGPNVLLVSQLAASGHRARALAAGVGIATVALVWAALAIGGVSTLFTTFPTVRTLLQLAGGIYLCYLAVRLWNSKPAGAETGKATSLFQSFLLGFTTNILNPKSALFFASIFGAVIQPDTGLGVKAAMLVLVFVNALVWHESLALVLSAPRVRAHYARLHRGLSRFASIMVGAYGVRVIAQIAADAWTAWSR
jgi:threonine efflux protein